MERLLYFLQIFENAVGLLLIVKDCGGMLLRLSAIELKWNNPQPQTPNF